MRVAAFLLSGSTPRDAANLPSIMISARNFGVADSLDRSDASFVKASRSESVSQGKQRAASFSTDAANGAPDHVHGKPNHQRRNSPMDNRHIIFGAILSALAFLPGVRAVVPAPDGCYPNFTTAEGLQCAKIPHHRCGKHWSWLVFAVFEYHGQLQHGSRRGSAGSQQRG